MPKYSVLFAIHASTSVVVEADSESEARDKAVDEVGPCLCWQCSKQISVDEVGEILEVIEV